MVREDRAKIDGPYGALLENIMDFFIDLCIRESLTSYMQIYIYNDLLKTIKKREKILNHLGQIIMIWWV